MVYIAFQVINLILAAVIIILTTNETNYLNDFVSPLFMLFFVVVFSFLTEVHKPKLYQRKFKYVIAPFFKYIFLFILSSVTFGYLFTSDNFNFEQILNLTLLASILLILSNSILIGFLLYFRKKEEFQEEINKYSQEELKIDQTLKLSKFSSQIVNQVFNIPSSVLSEIDRTLEGPYSSSVGIIKNLLDIKSEDEQRDILILDLELNTVSDINNILTKVYNRLKNGGVLILYYEEIEEYEKRYIYCVKTRIRFLRKSYYYLFKRALPKLPLIGGLSKIFFNKYTAISKAEMWGRLVYNGFDVMSNNCENNLTFVVARKIYEPSKNPNPSFYPLITLNRVSLYGKIIKIHKLRSMYPYSEFIQKKVFEANNLNNIGKFENDFRITKPGKVFRKYWFDEIPQFYDWLRGEIKLVGIRAMSQHFFSLYPNEYKEIYIQVKPGIISPIFDEKTTGFDDIVKIEQKYLESYLKNPRLTDIKYFFITLKQIIAGVRSK